MKKFKTAVTVILTLVIVATLAISTFCAISAPEASSITKDTVVLKAKEVVDGEVKYGYAAENDAGKVTNWTTETTFTGLEAKTKYYFFAKVGDVVSTGAEIETASQWASWISTATTIVPFILIAVAFWFFLIRPQKKQEKQAQTMRNSIEVGDTITTVGGITGIVRQIKEEEDTYIIETGADKSKIAIKKWAVQTKDTVSDAVATK